MLLGTLLEREGGLQIQPDRVPFLYADARGGLFGMSCPTRDELAAQLQCSAVDLDAEAEDILRALAREPGTPSENEQWQATLVAASVRYLRASAPGLLESALAERGPEAVRSGVYILWAEGGVFVVWHGVSQAPWGVPLKA